MVLNWFLYATNGNHDAVVVNLKCSSVQNINFSMSEKFGYLGQIIFSHVYTEIRRYTTLFWEVQLGVGLV